MGRLKVLLASSTTEWERALRKAEVDDVYFTNAYLSMVEANGEGRARLAVFCSSHGIVVYPFLIRRIDIVETGSPLWDVTSPYGYAGPFAKIAPAGSLDVLAAGFRDSMIDYMIGECVVSEFIRFHPLLMNADFLSRLVDVQLVRETVYVDLRASVDQIWASSINSKTRNLVRKAIKMGVTVRVLGSDGLGEFRRLYKLTMDRLGAHKYYHFSDAYFEHLAKILEMQGVVLEANLAGQIIASVVLLSSGPYSNYHLSASDPEARSVPATDLLIWEAIQWSRNRGCAYLNLGGGYSGERDSLFRFKAGFSPLTAKFHVGKVVIDPVLYEELCLQAGVTGTGYFPKYRNQDARGG